MESDWQKDKRWSDAFLPEIKRILGEFLLTEPAVEEDAERNTDLIVLKMDAVRIGCRIRRYVFLDRYGDEFTIRAGRPSGIKTEFAKIVEGWGDYLFYGFSNAEETALAQWFIGDLKSLRGHLGRTLLQRKANPWVYQKNTEPGGSSFAILKKDAIPGFIVKERLFHAP